ncbi:MAG: PASTA domain-containing protein [Acidobacteriota bacterium]
MWRKLLRATGCLGYLGILSVIFALVSYFTFSQFVRRGVTPTPELYGMGEGEAERLLADQGLRLAWSDEGERYDEQVLAGHVLIQEPRAGTLVKRGGTVTVIMSRGPRRIEVPDVMGNALQAAQVSLAAAGLQIGRTISVHSQQGATGIVVAQQPTAGSRVESDAAIDLFLNVESRGETYLMPDLTYLYLDNVRRYLQAKGIRIGKVSYENYGDYAPGTVLQQFPPPGHPLHRNDVIALSVVPPAPEVIESASEDDASLEPPTLGGAP